jgi:phage terminase large subunit-like protein
VIIRAGLTRSMNKRQRAVPAAAAFENKVLRINRDLPNLRDVLLELRRFDNGRHDDIVDGISGAYWALTQSGVQSETSVETPAAAQAVSTPASVAGMMKARAGRGRS